MHLYHFHWRKFTACAHSTLLDAYGFRFRWLPAGHLSTRQPLGRDGVIGEDAILQRRQLLFVASPSRDTEADGLHFSMSIDAR